MHEVHAVLFNVAYGRGKRVQSKHRHHLLRIYAEKFFVLFSQITGIIQRNGEIMSASLKTEEFYRCIITNKVEIEKLSKKKEKATINEMIIVALQQNIIETVLDCRAFALCRLRSAQMACQMKKQRAECLIVSNLEVIFVDCPWQVQRYSRTDWYALAYKRLHFAIDTGKWRQL